MALPLEKSYTIADIYALPQGQRAELIDGQMYMIAPPKLLAVILTASMATAKFTPLRLPYF